MNKREENITLLRKIAQNSYDVNVVKYLSRAKDTIFHYPSFFIGFTAIILLIIYLIGMVDSIAVAVFLQIMVTPLWAGYFYALKAIHKEEKLSYKTFFLGLNHSYDLILLKLLHGVLVLAGLFLLVIPGIYLAVAFSFAMIFIVFYELKFWEALEISRQIITKNWFGVFSLMSFLVLINFLAILIFGVGLIFTLPFSYCAVYYAFEDIVEKGIRNEEKKIMFR